MSHEQHSLDAASALLDNLEQSLLYKRAIEGLLQIVNQNGGPSSFEGNCMYRNGTFQRMPSLRSKQVNLVALANRKDVKRILEIGFNAGHSCLLFLLAN